MRPANLRQLLHYVNYFSLKAGDLGGGQAGLPEAGGHGRPAGFELAAPEGAERVPRNRNRLGRRAVHEKRSKDGLRFGGLGGQERLHRRGVRRVERGGETLLEEGKSGPPSQQCRPLRGKPLARLGVGQ